MSKQSDIVKVSQDAGTTGFVNTAGDTMTGNLLLPNLGVDTDDDTKSLRLSANATQGTTGVAIQLWGKDVEYWGGGIHYLADTRGVDGSHRFWTWDGSAFVNRAVIDEAGRLTLPYQPAFSATGSSGTNVTLSNPTALSLAATHFNRGNHYNTSTSKFTAPVAGVYQLNLVAYLNSDTATVVFLVNDVQIGASDPDNLLYKTTSSPYTMAMSICASLAANDTVSVSARAGSGSTTFYIGHTTFSGCLIG